MKSATCTTAGRELSRATALQRYLRDRRDLNRKHRTLVKARLVDWQFEDSTRSVSLTEATLKRVTHESTQFNPDDEDQPRALDELTPAKFSNPIVALWIERRSQPIEAPDSYGLQHTLKPANFELQATRQPPRELHKQTVPKSKFLLHSDTKQHTRRRVSLRCHTPEFFQRALLQLNRGSSRVGAVQSNVRPLSRSYFLRSAYTRGKSLN